jgi:hypothetical protein
LFVCSGAPLGLGNRILNKTTVPVYHSPMEPRTKPTPVLEPQRKHLLKQQGVHKDDLQKEAAILHIIREQRKETILEP